ncbi:hypothetical protein [Leptolyngbya sp. FACHB-261]|uniref:hypothetical protein n=1 Tax=Leptolyngbya sp. FACHB-261 TaxID=2692806 RepID=UPI001F54AF60|nr:hypothetical protein [Leptolyngbya sp. FACHB-261]
MDRWSLQFRLFCSHLIVMSVGMLTLLAVGRYSSPHFFILYLEEMIASEGGNVSVVRAKLVQGFEIAWTRGAAWSLVVGGTAAGAELSGCQSHRPPVD